MKIMRDPQPPLTDEEDEGITAYHGSPHDFPTFDMSKIGTGEGAQSYGHGLYFAEAEPVAHTYRGDPEERYRRFSGHMDPKEEYAFDLASHAGEKTDWDIMKGLATKYGEGISYEDAEKLAKNAIGKRGHMYEVRIKAKPEHFIDWDAPISEQDPYVWSKLVKEAPDFIKSEVRKGMADEKTWGDIYGSIVVKHPRGQQGVTEHLAELGIPGVRYLDQGSRGTGEGTRNYVVFDDKLVHTKRKYDKGGTVKNLFNPNYIPHDDPRRAQNLENFMPMKDENGEPMKVFHNTNREFSEFNTKSSELGTHFGTANQAANLQANQDNPLAKRRTMAAHISLRNPLRLTDQGGFSVERVAQQLYDMGMINDKKYDKHMEGDFRSEEAAIKDLQNVIKKAGYDGIVYLNRREGLSQHPDPETNQKNLMWHFAMGSRATDDEFKQKFPEAEDSYIIFEPNQAKNAVGNVGTFDPNQKDFNKARGGIVEVKHTGRITRNTGGRIPEMDKLFKRAKKYVDEQTKPMLNLHDDVIVKALNLAKKKV
jgi:hypothetical protein